MAGRAATEIEKENPGGYSRDIKSDKVLQYTTKLRQKRVVFVFVVFMIIISILLSAWIIRNKEQHINLAKINNLISTDNCSIKGLQTVKSERPTTSRIDASITLLSYRAYCYEENNQYSQANREFQQLKNYYSLDHDSAQVADVEGQIAANNYAIAHPPKAATNLKPEITQAQAQKIQSFYEADK